MPEREHQTDREFLFSWRIIGRVAGALAMTGLITGFAVESHTNTVAKGKVITAEYCLDTVPHETKITKAMEDCLESDSPAGRPIGNNDHFDVGDHIAKVDAYIEAQKNEAASIEPERLLGWTVGTPAVVVGTTALWLFSN